MDSKNENQKKDKDLHYLVHNFCHRKIVFLYDQIFDTFHNQRWRLLHQLAKHASISEKKNNYSISIAFFLESIGTRS